MVEVIVQEKDQEIKVGDLVRFKNTDLNGTGVYYVTEIFRLDDIRLNAIAIKSERLGENLFWDVYDLPADALEKFYGEVIFRQ